MYPEDLKYSKEHEWVRINGSIAEVGVTLFAQESLGDVVYVDLPEVGSEVEQFAKFGEIESVKAVSELNSPVSGKVVEVNSSLSDSQDAISESPFADGWMIKVAPADDSGLTKLLDASAYEAQLQDS